MKRYFVVEPDGQRKEIAPGNEAEFFRIIAQFEDLTLAQVRERLDAGGFQGSTYRYESQDVNPFSPAKVPIP
jgi:hypothetical protein